MQAASLTNADLIRRRAENVPRGVSAVHPIAVVRGEGARVWDADGREYFDFVGGIGVLNIGHANRDIVAAVVEQAQRFTHTCFQVTSYEPYIELAETLNRLAPGTTPKKTLLLSTGAEAVENAVKIARAHTGRPAVVTFAHGYHGRTLLTLSMTGKNAPYKQNFGPFCSEIYHAPFPHALHGWSSERALNALDELFETQCAADRIAALVIEPVLGEGGFIPAPADFLYGLRERCDRYGIVFVCDEIQSGFGRTGKRFAIEHAGIEPDILTMAKSLAGGMPLAAVVGKAHIMDAPAPGGLGGTYAGNPVACAAALAVLRIMDDAFFTHAATIGKRIRRTLDELSAQYPCSITEVRGLGAMVALEFDEPNGIEIATRVVARARDRGLLLMPAACGNVIRVLVPLIIDDHDLDEALRRLEASFADVLAPTEVKENS